MDEDVLITDLLQPGKSVQVEFFHENGKKIIYRTSIWGFEGEQLRVLVPKNDQILKSITPGAKITLICRNDTDSYDHVFTSQFIKAENEQPYLIINKPSDLKFGIGRHFFRCEVNLPFHFFTQKGKCPGEITNLSADGLYAVIDPNFSLEPGAIITCQMILPNSAAPILLVAKVIRTTKKENFQGVGLRFQQPDKNIQDRITQFLFQRQRVLMNLGQIHIVKSDS
jgi:c-di-GMP-binding flagellar brake protein YcgR